RPCRHRAYRPVRRISGSRLSTGRKLDVRQPEFLFEVDDFAWVSSLQQMPGELKDVAADEKRQGQEEDRHRQKTQVDRNVQKPQDRGWDADHMQNEGRRIGMPFQPAFYRGMRGQWWIDHAAGQGGVSWANMASRRRDRLSLTSATGRVSLANSS